MIISHRPPPNYQAILSAFPAVSKGGVIFAYGDTIYNPSHVKVTEALNIHEQVHSQQQGGDPEAWWDRYLGDASFRLQMELPAHLAEWLVTRKTAPNRALRRAALGMIAGKLSSPIYRYTLTKRQAAKLLESAEAVAMDGIRILDNAK